MKNSKDFKDIACAVIAGKLARPDYYDVGQGDIAADQRAAKKIRAAARTIYDVLAEEMDALRAMEVQRRDSGDLLNVPP